MADRPIIFSAPTIRALLDGRKSQTRRRIDKPKRLSGQNIFDGTWTDGYVMDPGNASWRAHCTPYALGDRLWVREGFSTEMLAEGECIYRATVDDDTDYYPTEIAEIRWRSPIHMPRWASRLTLIVTDVRVQRLQEISEADAVAEGAEGGCLTCGNEPCGCENPNPSYRDGFAFVWNTIHGLDAWHENPWVAALTFTVHRCNIDRMEAE